MSALLRLRSRRNLSPPEHSILSAISSFLNRFPSASASLVYVPSHSGVLMNEAIDTALQSLLSSIERIPAAQMAQMPQVPLRKEACSRSIDAALEEDEAATIRSLAYFSDTTRGSDVSRTALLMRSIGATRGRIRVWLRSLERRRPLQVLLLKIVTYAFFRFHG